MTTSRRSPWEAFKAGWKSDLDSGAGDGLSSPVIQPPAPDTYASPAETGGLHFDGPAPAHMTRLGRQKAPTSQAEVWDLIARKHPRKFRKAVAYLNWLERMEYRYSRRVL